MITKTLINRYLAVALTCLFTSAAVWAEAVAYEGEYAKFSYSKIINWRGTTATFHSGQVSELQADGNESDPYAMTADNTAQSWQRFAENQTAYSVPGMILRLDSSTAHKTLEASFSPWTFGGLIVEAEGYSLGPSNHNSRGVCFGDPSGETETYMDIHESFTIGRGSTETDFKNGFFGTVNLTIDEGKILNYNAAQTTHSLYVHSQWTRTRAAVASHLKMHGEGTLKVATLTATGNVTLDFSDLGSRVNTEPYIDGAVTVDSNTKILLPSNLALGTEYQLCSGTLTAPTKSNTFTTTINGEALKVRLVYDATNKTAYLEEAPSYTNLLLLNIRGTDNGNTRDPVEGWTDYDAGANGIAQLQPNLEDGITFSTAGGAGKYWGNISSAHFSDGEYVDIFGITHTTLPEEVKASLETDVELTADVYQTEARNGQNNEHTATIANLDPSKKYVIYIGMGSPNGNNQFKITAEGYTSCFAREYIKTVNNHTSYQPFDEGDVLNAGTGLMAVRLNRVIPKEDGTVIFSILGNSALSWLAVHELPHTEADYSANLDGAANNNILEPSELRGGFAPKLRESDGTQAFVEIRGSDTNKATKFTNDGFYAFTSEGSSLGSNPVGDGDFSLLAVAKLSDATTAPKVIMSIGNASWNTSNGLTLVYDNGMIKLVSWSHVNGVAVVALTDDNVIIKKEMDSAATRFHSYLVIYDNTNNSAKLFIDGESVTNEAVSVPHVPGRNGFELARIYGGQQFFKFGTDGAVFTRGNDFEFDEFAIWKSDVSKEAALIAADYPVWPTIVDYTADGDVLYSELKALYPGFAINLTMPDGATLTVDTKLENNIILYSEGKVAVADCADYAFTAADVLKITAGEIPGYKIVFNGDIPAGLTAPDSKVIYRFEKDFSAGITLNVGDGTYEFKNAKLLNNHNGTYKIRVLEGDSLTLSNNGFANLRSSESLEVLGGNVQIGRDDGDGSMWYGGPNTTFNLSGGTVTTTANGQAQSGTGNGLLLGYTNNGITSMNITGGHFNIDNTSILMYICQLMNITGSGRVTAKGVFQENGTDHTIRISENALFELGSLGWKGAKLELNGGTLKAYDTTTMSAAITVGGAANIEVEEEKTFTITGTISGTGVITKTGAGILDIGTNRCAVDIQEGKVKLVAKTDELSEAMPIIVWSLPSGVEFNEEDLKSKLIVVDRDNNPITIASISESPAGTGTITIYLSGTLPVVTTSHKISDLNIDPNASGVLVCAGGNTVDNAITITFDQDLPEGVTLAMEGYVKFVAKDSIEIPYEKMDFDENCTVMFDAIDSYEIPANAKVIAGTASGTIVNNGTLTIGDSTEGTTITNNGTLNVTGEGAFKLINSATATANFKSGADVTVSADTQTLRGTLIVEKGATFTNTTKDAISYSNPGTTFKVYGTLNMGSTRWTLGPNSILDLYGGCTINGTNEGEGNFDLFRQGNAINVYKVEGESTTVEVGLIRARNDTPANASGVYVDQGMTLIVNGGISMEINNDPNSCCKRGLGALIIRKVLSARTMYLGNGTITLDTGTEDFRMETYLTNAVANVIGTGTVIMKHGKNGSYLDLGTGTPTQTAHYLADSGTSTLKMRKDGNEQFESNMCENDSLENPFIKVNSGAMLNLYFKDFSGWGGSVNEYGWIVNNGTLKIGEYDGTRYFRNHLVTVPGATTTINGTTDGWDLKLYGGNEDAAKAQLYVTAPTGSNKIATINGETTITVDGAAGIMVEEGAELQIENLLAGSDELKKWGTGTLTLNNAANTYSGSLKLMEGVVKTKTPFENGKIVSGMEGYIIAEPVTEGEYTVYSLIVAKVKVEIPTVEGATISSVTSGGTEVHPEEGDDGKLYVMASVNQKLVVTYKPQTGMYIKNGVVSIVPTSDGANKIDISGVEVSNTPLANMPVVIKEKKGTKIRVKGLSEDGCAAPGSTLNISVALREGYEDLAVTINGSNMLEDFTEGEEYFTLDYNVDSSESEIVIITDCDKITE